MRVIPVLDLQDGVVVHAVKGQRAHYQPVASTLASTAEPLAVARAFRDKLKLHEFYVADLDAIQGRGHHQALIARLARQEDVALMVDAGTTDVEGALDLLAMGVSKVVVGSETLATWEVLVSVCAAVSVQHLVFSLDMRDGQVLSRSPQLATLPPLEVLERLQHLGWQEVILLDLARVGTGAGVDRALITEARRRYPQMSLLAGGGVRGADELWGLKALGVAGVLVATALHQGTITADDLRACRET
jgi:phosphoribosylformimino-5-aminoimidazole carboxamide ribotide isomerase